MRLTTDNYYMQYLSYFRQMTGLYPHEQFAYINVENIIPDRYIVTTYGRVFSTNTMREMYGSVDESGYRYAHMRTIDGGDKTIGIHRLVAMMFIPKTQEDLELGRDFVNHIDRITGNNCIWNLEWVTHEENVQHAVDTGYYHRRKSPISIPRKLRGPAVGDRSGMSRLTDEQVHKVCEALSQGLYGNECCEYAGLEYDEANRKLICNIARGARRTDISSQYTIPTDLVRSIRPKDEFIVPVCELLEKGYNIKTITEMIPIDDNYHRARKFVGNIKNRKSYKEISKDYDF